MFDSDELCISLSNGEQINEIRIYNQMGQQVFFESYHAEKYYCNIPSGSYIIMLKLSEKTIFIKLIKS